MLVYPAVQFGSRWLPRGWWSCSLVIVGLGTIGFVGYRIVNDVTQATDRLQEAAPARAAELEKNSDLLRQIHLRRARAEPRQRHPEPARGRIGHQGAQVGSHAAASRSSPA